LAHTTHFLLSFPNRVATGVANFPVETKQSNQAKQSFLPSVTACLLACLPVAAVGSQ